MNDKIPHWQFAGFGFTALLGTALHFLYDLCGKQIYLAPFSAINESTWEHMKILFFPLLIFAIIERIFLKEKNSFWAVKLKGIILGVCLIPILFYTYNGAFGKSPDWINIAIFFVAAAVSFIYETILLKRDTDSIISTKTAIIILCIISAVFMFLTFSPPQLPLFQDPISGTFGLNS